MTYLLLLVSGLLFALQFTVNKCYQTYKSGSVSSSVLYALLGKAAAACVFFFCVLGAGQPFIGNRFTFVVGGVQAALNLVVMVVGLYVLSVGSVTLYTVSMMIGGMAVPAVFGLCFLGDELKIIRIAAFVLIAVAVPLSAKGEKKKLSVTAFLLYAALFISNGAIGVFTALHTNRWGADVPDFTFMFVTSMIAAIAYIPVWGSLRLRERKKDAAPAALPVPKRAKLLYCASPYTAGVLNGIANLMIVIGTAASAFGSVVTFPLVTGGTILFTSVFALIFYREKPDLPKCLGIALILAALIMFIF